MTSPKWQIIGRGLAGWHAKAPNVRSSGGDLHDRPWWAGGIQAGYLANAAEGAVVYDAEHADPDVFARFVFSGPMCDPALAPDAVRRFGVAEKRAAAGMLPALGGEYQTITARALAGDGIGEYGSLDEVGTAIYVELLRAIPGIKIGTVENGAVVWQ